MIGFLRGTLLREGTIDESDPARLLVTDSPEEAARTIAAAARRRFALDLGAPRGHASWLAERPLVPQAAAAAS